MTCSTRRNRINGPETRTACVLIGLVAVGMAAIPPTPKKPTTTAYHGVAVKDDYQWLENWDDPAVRNWSEAQNSRARAILDALPSREQIRGRLKTLFEKTSATYYDLVYRLGVLFALVELPPNQQAFLITLASPDDPQSARIVIDPNRIDPKGLTRIDFYEPSRDGRLVAVSLSEAGSENGTLHLYEVATGKELPDVIPRVNAGTAGGSAAWNADGSGFYYTRYPQPGERPEADLPFYQQVFFHKLGTPTSQDSYSLGKDFPRIAEISLQSSRDGGYVLATVANGDGGDYAHYLLAAEGKWTQLTQFPDGIKRAVFGEDQALYVLSRNGAPRGKILRLPLDHPLLAKARTIVPEGDSVIQYGVPTARRLYMAEIAGGPYDLHLFDLEGRSLGTTPIEPVSSVWNLVALDGDTVLYLNESLLDPPAWFRFDPASGKSQKTALVTKSSVDFGDAEVVREFATSKDGTRIPLSIVRHKGSRLDGLNPTVLTGYGGFDLSVTPRYDNAVRLWLDHGGVWVIANLRGGGEYGEEWHKSGMLTRKQNVFDDFAACVDYLINSGYTNPTKLAIVGGSNGGLLMGAALTQHPQLFRAVVSFVGIYDMLRSEATTPNAVFNVTEYGTVGDAEQFKALYAYSPYHHVVDGTAYPAVLFLTGANDPRVNPMQSRKMTARLQAASTSGLPILLRTSADSGHGASSADEDIEQSADMFAFLFDELGMH
jgi:prolyl oligopeptidase